MKTTKIPLFIKFVSLTVSAIFLWNQMVWAADLPANPLPEDIDSNFSIDELENQRIANETTVSNKNAIEDFIYTKRNKDHVSEGGQPEDQHGGTVTYYNDADARLETREVLNETEEGAFQGKHVKYFYNNEDYFTDRGRISKVEVYETETLTYNISYVESSSTIISSITKEINSSVDIEVNYFADQENLINSITFSSADSNGAVYYEFLNEDWNLSGYGRTEIAELATANGNGEISFEYEYFSGTDQVRTITSFSDTAREKKIFIYEYNTDNTITYYRYDDKNNLEWVLYGAGSFDYYDYTYDVNDKVTEAIFYNSEYENIVVTEFYDYDNGYILSSRRGQGTYTTGSVSYNEQYLDIQEDFYTYTNEGDILVQTIHTQFTNSGGDNIDYYVINKYDLEHNLISSTENLTQAEYADTNKVAEKTYTWSYDSDGDILSSIDPDGNGYRYEYVKDSDGKILEIKTLILETGVLTIETFDEEERLLSFNEGDGHWDDAGNNIVVDAIPSVAKISNTYTAEINGIYTTTKHVEYEDAEGNQVNYDEITAYDRSGNIIFLQDRHGDISKSIYDNEGKLISEEYLYEGITFNAIVTYEYTTNNGIETVIATRKSYNDTERSDLKEEIKTTRTFDKSIYGNTLNYTELTEYIFDDTPSSYLEISYDVYGKILSESTREGTSDTETTTYTYNDDGSLNTVNYTSGKIDTYTYIKDSRGRLLQKTLTTDDIDIDGTPFQLTETINYDPVTGGIISIIDTDGNKTEYIYEYNESYDLSKKITNYYEDINGSFELKYTLEVRYDSEGRVTYDKDKNGVVKEYTYTLTDGIVTSITENITYTDESGNTITLSTTKNYSFDGELILTEVFTDGSVKTYTYDVENRLESTEYGNMTINYTYDSSSGALIEKIEVNSRGTTSSEDDITTLTVYLGVKGGEKIKEIRTFEVGENSASKPVIREVYHYNKNGTLARVVKKTLKADHDTQTTDIVEAEYEKDIEIFYGVFNGKIRKKNEVTSYGKEEFFYDEDGRLVESIFTDGIYFSKLVKKYDLGGDVVKTIKENGLENIITDTSYIKDSTGVITKKTETITYEKYNEAGNIVEETVLSVTDYEYYGEDPSDKDLYPYETQNHDIKNVYSAGKVSNFEYTYKPNGVLEYRKERVSWSEPSGDYTNNCTAILYSKLNDKGDIIASIDSDGTYSEYEYSTDEENEMGGRFQIQKFFHKLKDPSDIEKGYEIYKTTSFEDVDISGMVTRNIIRTYDFEGDLITVLKENGEGAGDDELTGYIYKKDSFGNILKKYEKNYANNRVKVTEYNLKNEILSETSHNGIIKTYSYERDVDEGFIDKIIISNSLYTEAGTVIEVDKFGNYISITDANNIKRSYIYEKAEDGTVISKTEHVTKPEDDLLPALDYTETYKYTPYGEISEFMDKNGLKSVFSYVYDDNGNVKSSETIVVIDPVLNAESKIIKEYNSDGTEKSVTEINDPGTDLDDIVKIYSYLYDDTTGILLSKIETDSRYTTRTEYEYDVLGDIVSVNGPNGIISDYLYKRDNKGNLLVRYTKNSNFSSAIEVTEYDIYGNETLTKTGSGEVLIYENIYDLKGNKQEVIAKKEKYISYDDDTPLWSFSESRTYDIFGRIISKIDKHGNNFTYTYNINDQGQVVSSSERDLRYEGEIIRTFDPLTGDILSETDRLGLVTTYEYVRSEEHGGIIEKKEISDTGEVTVYRFNILRQVESVTDKNGRKLNASYEFDDYGNMLKRTLTWIETIDGYDREMAQQEFYDVNGDLIKIIDYTGLETRYQYAKNEIGDLTHMTRIETSWMGYDYFENIYSISDAGGAQGVDLNNLRDADITTRASITWTESANMPRIVIDRDNSTLEYNTLQLDLRTDSGMGYKYKVYTATNRDDSSTWTLVDDKTDTFYEGFQESEFTTVTDRYVIIEGVGASDEENKLEIMESRIYNKKKENTVKIETTTFDADGRERSKTGAKGDVVFYNYEIGSRGEVLKIYEGLTPEVTIGVLTPVLPENIEVMDSSYSPDTSHLCDGNLESRNNMSWNAGSEPSSYVFDLTDDNTNLDDIGGLGLAFPDGDGAWFNYKIYYATAEYSTVWHELIDNYGTNVSTSSDWHVDKFDIPVSAKYIRLQGGVNYAGNNEIDIKEVKVYQTVERPDALKIKTLDKYGRVATEKNALMLAWEEREDLQELFPEVNEKYIGVGYWNNKTLTDWAKLMGSWEDMRLKKYLTNYDNKTYPAIKESFLKGDKSSILQNISAQNYTSVGYLPNIMDNNFDSRCQLEWADDNNPASYIVELGEVTTIDKIRLKLYETNVNKYKYKIYASTDGNTWGNPIILNDVDIDEDWQEHPFSATEAKYLKIEGITGWTGTSENPLRRLDIQEIMVFDSTDETPPETELTNFFTGVTVHNVSDGANYNSIIDDSESSYANIEWYPGNSPAYYVMELSSEQEIDKVSIYLTQDYGMLYKYKIYGSTDNQTWSELVDATGTYLEGKQYHLFDPTAVKYIKLEGQGALYGGSELTRIMVADFRIFVNGQPGYCASREYDANVMRDWAQNCGFRHDAELMRFAKINALTDKADVVDTTYKLDSNGIVRAKVESSRYTGTIKKFYDAKGRLTKEIISKENDITPASMEDDESCGYLNEFSVSNISALHCNRSYEQLASVIDANVNSYMTVGSSTEKAAFIFDLGEIRNINTVKVLPFGEGDPWYSYKIYTSLTADSSGWQLVSDRSLDHPAGWQTESFNDVDARYVIIEAADSSAGDDYLELILRELKIYGRSYYPVEELDAYGNVIKERYYRDSDFPTTAFVYQKVKMDFVEFQNDIWDHDQETKNRIIDGNEDSRINIQWHDGDTPASFLIHLENEEEIDRIRVRLRDSHRYKLFVRSQDDISTNTWHEIDSGTDEGTPINWQDIYFEKQKVKQIKIQGVENWLGWPEIDLYEVIAYKPMEVEDIAYLREFDSEGRVISEKNLLAMVWEENEDLRQYFMTPEAVGTGIYSGWTLKEWAAKIGSRFDSSLEDYKRYVDEYTSELAAVLDADPALKAQFTDGNGNLNNSAAVDWAKSCDKSLYPTLTIYKQDIIGLEDPYTAIYAYNDDESGNLVSRTKVVNLTRQTITEYDSDGNVISEETSPMDVYAKDYSYLYYENGNVRKMTVTKTGYEVGENTIVYNHLGDITEYDNYDYNYTYDKWKNIEKVESNGQKEVFLTNEEILDEASATTRIIEYFRAMLYREPTALEVEYYLEDWRATGFASLARDVISMTDEYINGEYSTFAEIVQDEYEERMAAIEQDYYDDFLVYEGVSTGLTDLIDIMFDNYTLLETGYSSRKDDNDKKYIRQIYRQELGRDPTSAELDDKLIYMRENDWSLEDLRNSLKNGDEIQAREESIRSVINSLYSTSTGEGILANYLNSQDKRGFLYEFFGFAIDSNLTVDISVTDIEKIILWLDSQDTHFGRSAVDSLYKELELSGNSASIEEMESLDKVETLLVGLIFLDIITGGITSSSQGMLLLSMFSIKNLAKKYGLEIYGASYSFEELVEKLNGGINFTGIVQYSGSHFMNVTGVVTDVNGDVTHIQVTDGYVDGIEQVREIGIKEFQENYEGNVLSGETPDYDKRLSDKQLLDIKGANFFADFFGGMGTAFMREVRKFSRAATNLVTGVVNTVVNFGAAIGQAFADGKWGKAFAAIGVAIVGIVVSILSYGSGTVNFLSMLSMMVSSLSISTAVCYGQYTKALIGVAVFVAFAVAGAMMNGSTLSSVGQGIGNAASSVGNWFSNTFSGGIGNAIANIGQSVWNGMTSAVRWGGRQITQGYNWLVERIAATYTVRPDVYYDTAVLDGIGFSTVDNLSAATGTLSDTSSNAFLSLRDPKQEVWPVSGDYDSMFDANGELFKEPEDINRVVFDKFEKFGNGVIIYGIPTTLISRSIKELYISGQSYYQHSNSNADNILFVFSENNIIGAIDEILDDLKIPARVGSILTAVRTTADISITILDTKFTPFEKTIVASAQIVSSGATFLAGIGGTGLGGLYGGLMTGGNPVGFIVGGVIGGALAGTAVAIPANYLIKRLKQYFYTN